MEPLGSSSSSPSFTKFRWTMSNFSQLTQRKYLSDSFTAGPCNWRIIVYPKGIDHNTDHLSIYLMVDGVAALPIGWSIDAEYSLTLVNQFYDQTDSTIDKGTRCKFSAQDGDCQGYQFKQLLANLHDIAQGYLLNDTLIVEAYVYVHKFNTVTPPQPQVDESSSSTNTATKSRPLFNNLEELGFFLKSEREKDDLELQKNLGTHIWNNKLLDNITREEEKLNKKLEEIKCRKAKLLVDMESDEAKVKCADAGRKVDETEEKKRPAEE